MILRNRLTEAFQRHSSAVLSFSGGKDSAALLHSCRDWADRIKVIHVSMGNPFPHVRKYVEDITRLYGYALELVESPTPEGTVPTDMLPVWSTDFGAWLLRGQPNEPQVRLISAIDCCRQTLWEPMQAAINASGATLVLRGSKGTDEHVGLGPSVEHEGVEYLSPLWEMTDTDVFHYLEQNVVPLPHQYQVGCVHSLDCIDCTGWFTNQSELDRVEYTRQYYPEQYRALQARMQLALGEIERRSEELAPAIRAIFPAT